LNLGEPYKKLIIKYRDSFGQHVSEIGTVPGAYFEIELEEDAKPYYTQPYMQSRDAEEEIKKQTKILVEQGLIEPSEKSEWQATCAAVPKKEDPITGKVEWRIVQDYRHLNLKTKSIQMVFPKIDDLTLRMGEYKYFTTLDMLSGYYHIKIPEKYRPYMAYGVTGMGSYQPTRMFFGLKNAPAYYQKMIQRILGNIFLQDWMAVYIDDIVIGANTKEELLYRTEEVIKKIRDAGLKIKLSKCEFEKEKVELLGWTITNNKRMINKKRIEAIKNWKYGEKMEKFIGMLTYVGKFIPAKAELLVPIRETIERTLNKKEGRKGIAKRPENDAEAIAAFETVKEIITSEGAIVNPKWDEPIEIYTDASDCGIGGVIRQEHGVIAYYAKTLKENEKGWSTFKKELYAILKTIEDNINLLKPHTPGMIKIFCDNKGVVELLKNTNREKIIEKNALNLYEQIVMLDLIIKHIPGKENTVADTLSRYHENVTAINKAQQKNKSKMDKIEKNNIKDEDHCTMNNVYQDNTYEINIVTNKSKKPKRIKRMDKYFGKRNLIRIMAQ
jgi:hypothetical protein